MKLSINQALQQALTAHKEGKFQDAERLYRAILQSQPAHPDANHNLGVLAVSVNKVDLSLPLFKIALEANPKIEQFWLSYIDALIKDNKRDVAFQIFEDAKKHGVDADRLISLKAQISPETKKTETAISSPPQELLNSLLDHCENGRFVEAEKLALSVTQKFPMHPFSWKVLGAVLGATGRESEAVEAAQKAVTLSPLDAFARSNLGLMLQKLGRANEARASLTKAIACKPDLVEAHYNLGITLEQLGRLDEAKMSYNRAITFKPNYAEAYSNLGLTLQALGSLTEAQECYKQAIALKPHFAEAHYNLGITLKELGRLEETEASYNQAITLKPDLAEAHSNLGNTLKELGRLDEALASYSQAAVLKPDFAETYYNLGNILQELNRSDKAIISFNNAVTLKPDFGDAHFNLGVVLTSFRAKTFSSQLEKSYLNTLNREALVRPNRISDAVITLLKQHNILKEAIRDARKGNTKNSVTQLCIHLSRIPLFVKIIELCPIADLEIEDLLKSLRKILLLERRILANNHDLLSFQSSLALQCFTNEFIYEETEEETLAVERLEATLCQPYARGKHTSPYEMACLSSYRPLHFYPWATDVNPPSALEQLFKRQVKEVNREFSLRGKIPRLKPLENDISLAVKKQYEENPYPRWIKTNLPPKPLTIPQLLSTLGFQLNSDLEQFSETPEVLVAGCGTGQHSLSTVKRFKDSHVTAVDLSLSSLCYAIRKTREYGVTNIDYIQADILDLELLDKQFDIVESVGVLHHMKDPLLGWRILHSCLKPGGLMKIGLYGEMSRKHVVKARDIISDLRIGTSHQEMIKFREYIKRSEDPTLIQLKQEPDFYSTSTFRDLVFHTQEHRFTAPELCRCFKTLNLTFIGFEYTNEEEKKFNEAQYPEWNRGTYGELTHESNYPAFSFWLQKPLLPEL